MAIMQGADSWFWLWVTVIVTVAVCLAIWYFTVVGRDRAPRKQRRGEETVERYGSIEEDRAPVPQIPDVDLYRRCCLGGGVCDLDRGGRDWVVMANDLVRWGWGNGDHHREQKAQDEAEEWDLPPEQPSWRGRLYGGAAPRILHPGAASRADQDATQARQRGDGTFAVQREADAAEHRQKKWDWGDTRTWLIIAGMCVGFLAFCLFVYLMPYGRHNQNDGPAPTPTIRVY